MLLRRTTASGRSWWSGSPRTPPCSFPVREAQQRVVAVRVRLRRDGHRRNVSHRERRDVSTGKRRARDIGHMSADLTADGELSIDSGHRANHHRDGCRCTECRRVVVDDGRVVGEGRRLAVVQKVEAVRARIQAVDRVAAVARRRRLGTRQGARRGIDEEHANTSQRQAIGVFDDAGDRAEIHARTGNARESSDSSHARTRGLAGATERRQARR